MQTVRRCAEDHHPIVKHLTDALERDRPCRPTAGSATEAERRMVDYLNWARRGAWCMPPKKDEASPTPPDDARAGLHRGAIGLPRREYTLHAIVDGKESMPRVATVQ
jgi:hypothetical protein